MSSFPNVGSIPLLTTHLLTVHLIPVHLFTIHLPSPDPTLKTTRKRANTLPGRYRKQKLRDQNAVTGTQECEADI